VCAAYLATACTPAKRGLMLISSEESSVTVVARLALRWAGEPGQWWAVHWRTRPGCISGLRTCLCEEQCAHGLHHGRAMMTGRR
jgi:hypothetical protein